MIVRKLAFVFLGLLGPMQAASAKDCLLSHATYREPRSGAVLQFRPLDNEPAAATTQAFSLTVPHTDTRLPADRGAGARSELSEAPVLAGVWIWPKRNANKASPLGDSGPTSVVVE